MFDGRGWSVFYSGVLCLGFASTVAMTTLGLARSGSLRLLQVQLLLPLYWLLIAGTTLNALAELLRRPFYWFKTPHEPVTASKPTQPERLRLEPLEGAGQA